jgi:hypothetical protein
LYLKLIEDPVSTAKTNYFMAAPQHATVKAAGNVSGCVTHTSLVEHQVSALVHIFLPTENSEHPAFFDKSPWFIRQNIICAA